MRLALNHIDDNRGLSWIVIAATHADALDSWLRHPCGLVLFFYSGSLLDHAKVKHRHGCASGLRIEPQLGAPSVNSRRNRRVGRAGDADQQRTFPVTVVAGADLNRGDGRVLFQLDGSSLLNRSYTLTLLH